MTASVRVYVNEHPIDVPAGTTVADGVRAHDPGLAERLERGEAHATDGRGVRIAGDAPLGAGAIVRVVVSSRRPAGPADARA